MKLQLCMLLSIFACVNLNAMEAEKDLVKKEDTPAQRQLTLIDLDQIDQKEFASLNDQQKWKLFDDSREVMRRYASLVSDHSKILIQQRALIESLSALIVAPTQLNLQNQEKN